MMSSRNPSVIVVGAGILGSSIAYHLARRNVQVTLIEKAAKPASEVTEKSFSWITAAHDNSEAYFNLRQQAIIDWRRIEVELNGKLEVNWSGALTWHAQTEETECITKKLLNIDYNVRIVERKEISLLEPNLKQVPELAMFAKDEGAINSGLTTKLFVKAAEEAGAVIQLNNEVLSLITNGSRVTGVVTANGSFKADVVVLATGADTMQFCKMVNIALPLNISPAILIRLKNERRFLNRIISNPLMEIRPESYTFTLAAEDYVNESIENSPQSIAKRTLANIKQHWQGTGQMNIADVVVGRRPIPQDGLPIIGLTSQIDGLYLSVMHAGVTLAAIIGRLAATEILTNQDNNLLSSYKLKRFS